MSSFKKIIKTSFAALMTVMLADVAGAYDLTIVNLVRNEQGKFIDILFDVQAVGGIKSSMFRGVKNRAHKKNHKRHDYGNKNIRYDYAGRLIGPQRVPGGYTVTFSFQGFQKLGCFKETEFKAAIFGGLTGVVPLEVVTVGSRYQSMQTTFAGFSGSLKDLGKAISEMHSNAKPAQAAGVALDSLFKGIYKLAQSSTCRNVTIMVVNGNTKPGMYRSLIGLTQSYKK
ncbi:MAG: hypothetical protein ACPGXY_06900 [Alphaproteobacteria bacterium]